MQRTTATSECCLADTNCEDASKICTTIMYALVRALYKSFKKNKFTAEAISGVGLRILYSYVLVWSNVQQGLLIRKGTNSRRP